jgi:molecular chaperone IbpA
MRYDFSPYYRNSVGFDQLFQLLDSAARVDEANAYPPYNIEKTGDDSYRITMAVAGFALADLNIVAHNTSLAVTGKKPETQDGQASYLHRGIAGRAFERRFQLADHVHVTGANLADGLLHIDLKREVPEAMRPRAISIETKAAQTQGPQLDAKQVN